MKRAAAVLLLSIATTACILWNSSDKKEASDLADIVEKGELTAITLYSSTSYFIYKTEQMGFEYEMISSFAKSKGLKLNIKVAPSLPRLMAAMENGEADVAAYPVIINNSLKERFIFCGHVENTYQALVQAILPGQKLLSDVTELIGKEVYVKSGAPSHERLKNLNEELGGGVAIKAVEEDLTDEKLIEMTANGEIAYTVADDKTARLNRTYYNNIDVRLALSFRQRSSWIVSRQSPQLAAAIDLWATDKAGDRSYKAATKRYFEAAKALPNYGLQYIDSANISPYDALFRKYSRKLNWDWRLLAAIAYQESHFLNDVDSWSRAKGLMGIMPRTAEALGISPDQLNDPETNIMAGTEVLRRFRSGLPGKDSIEHIKLSLAAYNAGLGHVQDACRLAEMNGKLPDVWDGNVADCILLKREPEYYNNPACKHGYLRGGVTFTYVKEVLERYEFYKTKIRF